MRKATIWAAGALMLVGTGALAVRAMVAEAALAESAPPALLNGCGDIPEAVALADMLRQRQAALDRTLADLDRRKAELVSAEGRLTDRLVELRKTREAIARSTTTNKAGRDAGISRLIAVYDAMKPAEAAQVIAALPPDFAAEILARVQPDNSARIIAAIEPTQAAILTARMGTRRLGGN